MSLLSYVELMELVEQGVIRNVDPSQVNAASIDVRLGGAVLRELDSKLCAGADSARVLAKRDALHMERVAYPYILEPREFVLASTIEEFWLPDDISAQFQLKSSAARLGVEHLKAGWCDAGWHGSVLTLELLNVTRYHCIQLDHGAKIGQLAFFRHTPVPAQGSYAARGSYNNDKAVQATKKERDDGTGN
jgi:dCTP deaminase